MLRATRQLLRMSAVIAVCICSAWAQQIPDAPSAVQPPPTQFPANTKAAPVVPAPVESNPSPSGMEQPATSPSNPGAMPSSAMQKAGPRPVKSADDDGRDQFTFHSRVSFVTVPVTVKDPDGHLVEGLLRRDFSIYEDGNPEPITLFTSDPFPLSAAVIIDQSMPNDTLKKVNSSISAMEGAFSQFDEVALYTFGNNATRASEFGASDAEFGAALRRNSKRSGSSGGVPVVSGPMASGPTVNGHPLDPGAPSIQSRTPEKESHALNDAILLAAQDLSRRPAGRRKIIFVISEGSEQGSRASYAEVLKALLSHEIAVYGVGVDAAAIPVYDTLNKIHIPGAGFSNLLPKYVSATGGEYYAEFTRANIEAAYSKVTEVARNQYTLGYNTRATAASNYRTIEVRVKRPGLKVFAKDGYYPLPPQRMNP